MHRALLVWATAGVRRTRGGTTACELRERRHRERFAGSPEVSFHRKTSGEAHSEFPNDFFDWVYVDGSHDYDSVKSDLELYFPKVKPDGFLTGDDYFLPCQETGGPAPVKQAVQDFGKENQASIVKIIGGQFIIQKN